MLDIGNDAGLAYVMSPYCVTRPYTVQWDKHLINCDVLLCMYY